jgi:hypothetical protein
MKMAKNTGGDTPNGTRSAQKSAAEHDEIRRAKKAHQRHGGTTKPTSGNLFEEILADRKQAAEEARLGREVAAFNFRLQQVEAARQLPEVADLKAGSVAERFASFMLDAWANADPQEAKSRTEQAALIALDLLSDTDQLREGAIRKGKWAAGIALRKAYDLLKSIPVDEKAASA